VSTYINESYPCDTAQASDVSLGSDPSKVIPGVVSATQAILKAAAEASIQRVVLTSSSTAALLPQPGVEGIVVTDSK
jgi:nucleoside-diphosphate-sugar epimerase